LLDGLIWQVLKIRDVAISYIIVIIFKLVILNLILFAVYP